MKRLVVALAALGLLAGSAPALAAAKNYDCLKAGNANKAACKAAVKDAAKAAAKLAPAPRMPEKAVTAKTVAAPKPAATNVSSTTSTKTVTAKSYDCSKPGNRNKAVCKTAGASPAKPVVKQTTVATQTRSYDCTKAGNANKEQCKVSTLSRQAASKPVAVPKTTAPPASPRRPAAAAPKRTAGAAPASAEDRNPAGAIAQCKDGTYSHAKARTGACARHGGVAKWS